MLSCSVGRFDVKITMILLVPSHSPPLSPHTLAIIYKSSAKGTNKLPSIVGWQQWLAGGWLGSLVLTRAPKSASLIHSHAFGCPMRPLMATALNT